jgi:uncharacterized repeat protein (TIGR01451 family)
VAAVIQTGTFTILASKTTQGEGDPVGSNNASGVILNGQAADVQVLKTVDVSTPLVGHTVTFTVTVINNGPSAATGVAVTEQVPAGLTVLAATPSQGTYAVATGVWTVGTLASSGAGAMATLRIETRATQAGDWTNLATKTALDQANPNPANDQGTATVHTTLPVTPICPAPPVARDDTITTATQTPVTIAVLANDSNPAGTPLTVVGVTPPLGGTVMHNPDATLTYASRSGFLGPETFTYTISDGRGCTATATVTVRFTNVFDPPTGRKMVNMLGLTELVWRMVWINNGNTVALRTRVVDPLPAATTYVDGSVTCEARGRSTVLRCAFDAAQNQVIYEGDIGADPGALTEEQAPNAVVITFRMVPPPGAIRVDNQALAQWDAQGTGTLDAPGSANQVPVRSGTAFGMGAAISPASRCPVSPASFSSASSRLPASRVRPTPMRRGARAGLGPTAPSTPG